MVFRNIFQRPTQSIVRYDIRQGREQIHSDLASQLSGAGKITGCVTHKSNQHQPVIKPEIVQDELAHIQLQQLSHCGLHMACRSIEETYSKHAHQGCRNRQH